MKTVDGDEVRFYQASSSEMFGNAPAPQKETTPLVPASPYAASKIFSHHMVNLYRDAYDLFAVSGILFNHESPRRHESFVTRKITKAAASIKLGLSDHLTLGNLSARRDWGYAPEYVNAMWKMLQTEEPADFVLATGRSYSVEDFLRFSFGAVGLEWEKYVTQDPKYLRPLEVDHLLGDACKAKEKLGWEPLIYGEELAKVMVDADLGLLKNGPNTPPHHGRCRL